MDIFDGMERLNADRVDPRVLHVLRTLADAGHEAWIVGGAVRDLLLGGVPAEWDLACDAPAEAIAGLFPRVVETGLAHGTVTVVHERLAVEVTTFRGPAGAATRRIEVDLAHRDLTVNAIAWDPLRGVVLDPCGGRADLQARCIRAVGDAAARFDEDPVRTLRAVRFASTLGFRLERRTRRAIPAFLDRLEAVAVERIRQELQKLLLGSRPRYGVELLRRTGILARILPELLEGLGLRQNRWHRYDVYHHVLHVLEAAPPVLEVRLAALLHDIDKPRTAAPSRKHPGERTFYNHEASGAERARAILERLRFPNRVVDTVVLLVREHQFVYDDTWSDAAVRRMLARVGRENFDALLALREADVRGRGRRVEEGLENVRALGRRVRALRERELALDVKDLALDGREVMEILGEGPSPRIGEAMRFLLGRVLEEPSVNEPDTLRTLLLGWKAGRA